MRGMKRLPDSELEIMLIIWELDAPATRTQIEMQMARDRKLSPTTILSFLSRLREKGFLEVQKEGRNNVYRARISRTQYMQEESKNIVKRMYQNSAKNFLTALYDGNNLSAADLEELERYISRLRAVDRTKGKAGPD